MPQTKSHKVDVVKFAGATPQDVRKAAISVRDEVRAGTLSVAEANARLTSMRRWIKERVPNPTIRRTAALAISLAQRAIDEVKFQQRVESTKHE